MGGLRGLVRRAKPGVAEVLYRAGGLEALLRARRSLPLVLRYHRVYPDGDEPFYELGVSRSLFERQLDFLAARFNVVSLAEVYDGLFDGRPLAENSVAITFDDGYRDNYTEAFPALTARGLPATLFVSVDNVEEGMPFWWDRLAAAVLAAPSGRHSIDLGGEARAVELDGESSRRDLFDLVREAMKLMPNEEARALLGRLEDVLCADASPPREPMLSWAEIAEMADGVFDIGSHTLDHPVLSRLSPEEAERQIVESRARLEAELQRPIPFFSYPNGKREDVTPAVLESVRRAGYRGAVSTIEGRARPRSDPFLLERVGATVGACTDADGRFSEALFAAELSGLLGWVFMRRRRGRSIY